MRGPILTWTDKGNRWWISQHLQSHRHAWFVGCENKVTASERLVIYDSKPGVQTRHSVFPRQVMEYLQAWCHLGYRIPITPLTPPPNLMETKEGKHMMKWDPHI